MFLISAKGKWGTEIRDWSKVMLKSLLVCPWLTDSFAVPLRGILNCATALALLSHCQCGKRRNFEVPGVLAEQRWCFPTAGGDTGQGWILGISIALSWACSKAAAFCAAVLLTQPHHSAVWCFFKPHGFSSRYRGLHEQSSQATHVWGTTKQLGCSGEGYLSGLAITLDKAELAVSLSSLAEWRKTEVADFLICKIFLSWISSLKTFMCSCPPTAVPMLLQTDSVHAGVEVLLHFSKYFSEDDGVEQWLWIKTWSARALLCSSIPLPFQPSCCEGESVFSCPSPPLSSFCFPGNERTTLQKCLNKEIRRWWDVDKHFVYINVYLLSYFPKQYVVCAFVMSLRQRTKGWCRKKLSMMFLPE